MPDDYVRLQQAKDLVSLDETESGYYEFLYLALRFLKTDFKTSVRLVNSLANEHNFKIRYGSIWDHSPEKLIEMKEFLMQLKVMRLDDVRNDIDKDPENNLGNLLLLEATTFSCNPQTPLKTTLNKLRLQLVGTGG
jgi:hypothetical protein